MSGRRTGGCACGAVRYRCGPLLCPPTLCHCESCRRYSGAHVVGWLTARDSDFALTAGSLREVESSPGVHRGFCAECGTPLTYRHAARVAETDVTISSLDDPASVVPVDHIWMADALPWDRPGDGLPQYPARRPD